MVERYLKLIFLLLKFSFHHRGKRKLAQVTKEAKEQLADLQSKIEMINAGRKRKEKEFQPVFY